MYPLRRGNPKGQRDSTHAGCMRATQSTQLVSELGRWEGSNQRAHSPFGPRGWKKSGRGNAGASKGLRRMGERKQHGSVRRLLFEALATRAARLGSTRVAQELSVEVRNITEAGNATRDAAPSPARKQKPT